MDVTLSTANAPMLLAPALAKLSGVILSYPASWLCGGTSVGYGGPNCTQPLCPGGCQSNAYCHFPCSCKCNDGFYLDGTLALLDPFFPLFIPQAPPHRLTRAPRTAVAAFTGRLVMAIKTAPANPALRVNIATRLFPPQQVNSIPSPQGAPAAAPAPFPAPAPPPNTINNVCNASAPAGTMGSTICNREGFWTHEVNLDLVGPGKTWATEAAMITFLTVTNPNTGSRFINSQPTTLPARSPLPTTIAPWTMIVVS